MPVVELRHDRLGELLGGGHGEDEIAATLPYLGLDIEGRTGGGIRVEYSPNRPDYSTDYGIAAGLRGLLGIKEGAEPLRVRGPAGKEQAVRARSSVSAVRPFVTAVAASAPGGAVGAGALEQFISMQEDLHAGIGRGRRAAAVGIHDMEALRFPLEYAAAPGGRAHRFVPLDSGGAEVTAGSIIDGGTKTGAAYGRIIRGARAVPLITDAAGLTVSLPPIINAARTAVAPGRTKEVLVEVTGTRRRAVEDALSVAAATLNEAGFALRRVKVSGAGNRTPPLGPRTMRLDAKTAGKVLGLDMTARRAAACLRRSRLDARARGGRIVECAVPRHRFDVRGPMDLVEEVAIGYGVGSIEPAVPPCRGPGRRSPGAAAMRAVRLAMVGLGYTEALSPTLSSARVLYGNAGRDPAAAIPVADPQSGEHTVLRDSLLPGMLDALSRNVHEPYPQRLFEAGPAFARGPGNRVREGARLCAVSSHARTSYTEIKAALAAAAAALPGGAALKTVAQEHPVFEKGRSAAVLLGGAEAGSAGEVGGEARKRFRIREPVAAFEVELPINI